MRTPLKSNTASNNQTSTYYKTLHKFKYWLMQVNELISEHSNTMSNTILSNNGVTIFIPQKVTKQEIIIRSQATYQNSNHMARHNKQAYSA